MQDALNLVENKAAEKPIPLPLRNDTLLGVCEGLGEELGINPNILRILFAACLFLNAALVVGVYLALGVVLAAARFVFPARRPAAKVAETVPAEANDTVAATTSLAA